LILQNIEDDYGMFVWPCSVSLAEYVWQKRSRFSGSRVVEVPLIFISFNTGGRHIPMFNVIYIYEFCYGVFGVTERYRKLSKVFFNLSH
jgi:hypothetical protein